MDILSLAKLWQDIHCEGSPLAVAEEQERKRASMASPSRHTLPPISPDTDSSWLLQRPRPQPQPLPPTDEVLGWLLEDERINRADSPLLDFLGSLVHTRTDSIPSDDNFIDLTSDSSPVLHPQQQQQQQPDEEPARKRRRITEDQGTQTGSSSAETSSGPTSQTQPNAPAALQSFDGVAEVDLTHVEDEADLKRHREELRERQRQVEKQQRQLINEVIKTQASPNQGVSRLSQLSCIICMETMTDLTATHCGKWCRPGVEPGRGLIT